MRGSIRETGIECHMRSENRSRWVNRVIGGLADVQRGCVARWQLLAAGLTAAEVARRIQGGLLRPVHRGVYLVGHRARAPYAAEMAAVLALGEGAAVSHRSAAAMMELLPYPDGADVWITAIRGDGRSRPGIRLHRSRLSRAEVHRLDRIPLTTPSRTLLDLAAVVGADQLERAVASGRRAGTVRESDLRRQLGRCHGRRGAGRLRALLDREAEPAFTRSEMERILLRLIRRHELLEPETNAQLHGHEVDFLWREHRVVVETDGRAFHSDPLAFTRDRVRSNDLQLHGYTVLRFTWTQLTQGPELVVSRIRAALGPGQRD